MKGYLKLEDAMEWKRMWKQLGEENLKATIPSKLYDRSQIAAEYGIFQLFR
jgi:hypothetical protein